MCIQNTKKIHKLAGVEQGRTGQKKPTAYYTHILNKVILFNNIFILENLKSDIWWGGPGQSPASGGRAQRTKAGGAAGGLEGPRLPLWAMQMRSLRDLTPPRADQ